MANTVTLGATCFAGLGLVVRDALARLGASNIAIARVRNHDYVKFRLKREQAIGLGSLHVVEDVFLEIARTAEIRGRSDIRKLCAPLGRYRLLNAIALKNDIFETQSRRRRKTPSYWCFVRQDHDRPIHRRLVAAGVNSAINSVFPLWRTLDPADLEFWVFWSNEVSLTLRLSDQTLKYRNRTPPKRPGALRPTVAAAMVELAGLEDAQSILDPFCGTGTVLAECQRRFEGLELSGSDQSAGAIRTATARLGEQATIRQAGIDELDYAPCSFDRILTNLPWGRQTPVRGRVYTTGVAKLLHWVAQDGRVVALTTRRDLLEPTLRRSQARWTRTPVLVQGTWASIYVIPKPPRRRGRA